MIELQKLVDEHNAKVRQLQDNCPHEKWGKWTDYMWAWTDYMWAPVHMARQTERLQTITLKYFGYYH